MMTTSMTRAASEEQPATSTESFSESITSIPTPLPRVSTALAPSILKVCWVRNEFSVKLRKDHYVTNGSNGCVHFQARLRPSSKYFLDSRLARSSCHLKATRPEWGDLSPGPSFVRQSASPSMERHATKDLSLLTRIYGKNI